MNKKPLLLLTSFLLATPLCSCSNIDENRTIILTLDTPLTLSTSNFSSNYGSGAYDHDSKKYTHNIDKIKDIVITISYDGYQSKTVNILTEEMTKKTVNKTVPFNEVLNCEVTLEISNVFSIENAAITDVSGKKVETKINKNKLIFVIPERDSRKIYKYTVQIDDYSPYELEINGLETVTGKYTNKIAVLRSDEFCVTFTYNGTWSLLQIYDAIKQELIKEVTFNSYPASLQNEVVVLNKNVAKSYYYVHNNRSYAFEQINQKIYLESYESSSDTFYINLTSISSEFSSNACFYLDTKNKIVLPQNQVFTLEMLDNIAVVYNNCYLDESYMYTYSNYYLDNFKDLLTYSEYGGVQLEITNEIVQKSKNIKIKQHAYHSISKKRQESSDISYEKTYKENYNIYLPNEIELRGYDLENDTLTHNIYGIDFVEGEYSGLATIVAPIYKNNQKIEDFSFKINVSDLLYKYSDISLEYISLDGSKVSLSIPYVDSYFTVSESSERVISYKYPLYIDNLDKAIPVMYEASDGRKGYVSNPIYNEKTGKKVKQLQSGESTYIIEPNIIYSTSIYNEDGMSENLRFSVTQNQIDDGYAYVSKIGTELENYSALKEIALRDNTKFVPYSLKLNNNYGYEIFEKYYTSIVSNESGVYNFKFSKPEKEILVHDINVSYRDRYTNELVSIEHQFNEGVEMSNIQEFSDLYRVVDCQIDYTFQSQYLFMDQSSNYFIINPQYKYSDISHIEFNVYSPILTESKTIKLSEFTYNSLSGCYEYTYSKQ